MNSSARRNLRQRPICDSGLLLLLAAVVASQFSSRSLANDSIKLNDVSSAINIDFQHTDGSTGEHYIVETLASGIALFDFDNDGDDDVYLLNGNSLPNTAGTTSSNRLYRNDGSLTFTDVTIQSGLGDTGYALGVACADYDHDGDQDLYVTNFGHDSFYENNGDGSFRDISERLSSIIGGKLGAGVCFLDADNDGNLDLYVANYVNFTFDNHQLDIRQGISTYPGPDSFTPAPDSLLRSNGNGTFTDISRDSGINALVGAGMGCISADFDEDGDMDIFVCNDSMENAYLENDGAGKFQESALLAGLAYDATGESQGSMGADCADLNNDGRLDIYQTSFEGQLATLYSNFGAGVFEGTTRRSGAGAGTYSKVTWGLSAADFDLDADKDLFVACGHIFDNVQSVGSASPFKQSNVLLRNDRDKFTEVPASVEGKSPGYSSRGCATSDLDHDGDIDVIVLNTRERISLLRNDSSTPNHWIQLTLVGRSSNRDAVGAVARVTAGGVTQTAAVHSGRGYQSHFGTRLHFGLASANMIDRIEVRWPAGELQVINSVRSNQMILIQEGVNDYTRVGQR